MALEINLSSRVAKAEARITELTLACEALIQLCFEFVPLERYNELALAHDGVLSRVGLAEIDMGDAGGI